MRGGGPACSQTIKQTNKQTNRQTKRKYYFGSVEKTNQLRVIEASSDELDLVQLAVTVDVQLSKYAGTGQCWLNQAHWLEDRQCLYLNTQVVQQTKTKTAERIPKENWNDLTALAWPSPRLTPLISNNSPITDSISFNSIVPEASTEAGDTFNILLSRSILLFKIGSNYLLKHHLKLSKS